VEFDVLQLDGFDFVGRATRGLKHQLVVQTQLQLGHATEETLHLDAADDLAVQHGAVAGHEDVELLDNVQKDFVLAMLDAFGAPRHGVGEGNRWARGALQAVTLLGHHSV